MARHIPFNFKGGEASKFFVAGMNYVNKVVGMNRPKATLITYISNNKEEVCVDGCTKGFCTGDCKSCKVQGAYEKGLIIIALKPEYQVPKELPPCQRYGMTWNEFQASRKKD